MTIVQEPINAANRFFTRNYSGSKHIEPKLPSYNFIRKKNSLLHKMPRKISDSNLSTAQKKSCELSSCAKVRPMDVW